MSAQWSAVWVSGRREALNTDQKGPSGQTILKKKTDEKQTAAAHTLVCCAKEFGLHSEGYGVSAEGCWRTTGSAPAQCRDLWF